MFERRLRLKIRARASGMTNDRYSMFHTNKSHARLLYKPLREQEKSH